MKRITTILLICCCSVVFAQETKYSARDRAKHQLVIRAVAQKIDDILESPSVGNKEEIRALTSELNARMQSDVSAHADPQTSRKLCVGILREKRIQEINRQIDDFIKQAAEHSALPVNRENVMTHVGADWNQRITKYANKYAASNIDTTFTKARKQSVALQRDEVKDRIKMPAEIELNSQLNMLAKKTGHHPLKTDDLNGLSSWVESFASTDVKTLFKEVRHSNHELSERIVQRVKEQYNSQFAALKKGSKNLPYSAIDAEAIQVVLQNSVLKGVETLNNEYKKSNPDSKSIIYKPFTVITDEAKNMAKSMQQKRIATAIVALKNLPIRADAVESLLRSNINKHVVSKQSYALLVSHYAAEIKPWIIKNLDDRAGHPNDTKYYSKYDAIIKNSKHLIETIKKHTGATLNMMLPNIRAKIMNDQLQDIFGQDPAEIDVLTAQAVNAIWETGRYKGLNDFNHAWQALNTAGLISDGADKSAMFEETRGQIVEIAKRLISVAANAVREQENMLKSLEREWTPKLRKDVESGRSADEITGDWSDEMNRRWMVYSEKKSVPYPYLFDRTVDMLNKTVRKLFESVKAELESAKSKAQAAKPKPEEKTTVKEPPPEETLKSSTAATIEKMLETLDFVLYFRDTSRGKSEAVLLNGKGEPTKVDFDPNDVTASVDEVYKAVIPAIESAVRNKAQENPKRKGIMALLTRARSLDLKMAVLVGSKQVRYMTSILLRNRVELFVKDWNANPANSTLELEWEDNLEIAQ